MHLLIDDVRLWNGTGSAAQSKMSVEVRDGRIHWIGSASEWQGSRSAVRVVDGRAKTLVPGLMDCHVHYSGPGGPEWIAIYRSSPRNLNARSRTCRGESAKRRYYGA
jgi:predicted amidohydrolase YtcJ